MSRISDKRLPSTSAASAASRSANPATLSTQLDKTAEDRSHRMDVKTTLYSFFPTTTTRPFIGVVAFLVVANMAVEGICTSNKLPTHLRGIHEPSQRWHCGRARQIPVILEVWSDNLPLHSEVAAGCRPVDADAPRGTLPNLRYCHSLERALAVEEREAGCTALSDEQMLSGQVVVTLEQIRRGC